MNHPVSQVWMYGTFDVDNYGDLLLPLIAHHKLGDLARIVPVSPEGYRASYSDHIPSADIAIAGHPDLILIGGGNIISRNVKTLAEHQSWIHDTDTAALSIWVGPFVRALADRTPVIWNAPGCTADVTAIGGSLRQTIERWISLSTVGEVAFRDHESARIFSQIYNGHCRVIPDTGYDLSSIYSTKAIRDRFQHICHDYDLPLESTFVVQLKPDYLDCPLFEIAEYIDRLAIQRKLTPVLLPLGLCHGDLRSLYQLSTLLKAKHALIKSEFSILSTLSLIARSQLFVGSSYHGAITAATYGTEVLLIAPEIQHKFDDLESRIGIKRSKSWRQLIDHDLTEGVKPSLCQQSVEKTSAQLHSHWSEVRNYLSAERKSIIMHGKLPSVYPTELPPGKKFIYKSLVYKPLFSQSRSVCPICGARSFDHGGSIHFKMRRICNQCKSRPRHRTVYTTMVSLGIPDAGLSKALMFSRDPSISKDWFDHLEYSVFGLNNSLDLEQIEREDESYDFIILNHVLEHVADHTKALRELSRICTRGGYVILTVPSPALFTETDDWGFPNPEVHNHYRTYGSDFHQFLQQNLKDFLVFQILSHDPVTLQPDFVYIAYKQQSDRLHLDRCFPLGLLNVSLSKHSEQNNSVLEHGLWHLRRLIQDFRFERAAGALNKLKLSFPHELRVLLLEIDLNHYQENYDLCRQLLDELQDRLYSNERILLRYIRCLIANGNINAAMKEASNLNLFERPARDLEELQSFIDFELGYQ